MTHPTLAAQVCSLSLIYNKRYCYGQDEPHSQYQATDSGQSWHFCCPHVKRLYCHVKTELMTFCFQMLLLLIEQSRNAVLSTMSWDTQIRLQFIFCLCKLALCCLFCHQPKNADVWNCAYKYRHFSSLSCLLGGFSGWRFHVCLFLFFFNMYASWIPGQLYLGCSSIFSCCYLDFEANAVMTLREDSSRSRISQ